MNTLTARPMLVTGPLEAAVNAYLRGLNFAPYYLDSTIAHVGRFGTAAGAPGLELADVEAVNGLICRHTGDVESDPASWPAWTDADVWVSVAHDDAPPPQPEAFEPTDADKIDWARELSRFDAEDDPDWTRGIFGDRITDEDVVRATGCCG